MPILFLLGIAIYLVYEDHPENSGNQPVEQRQNIVVGNVADNGADADAGSRLLDKWLIKLAAPGNEHCPANGVMDSGSKSYGALCFKLDTFQRYVRRYELLPYAEDAELMNWIGDADFQHQLAKRMILEDYGNWRHWKNTVVNKIGYPPRI